MEQSKYELLDTNRRKAERLKRDISKLESMLFGFSFHSTCDSYSNDSKIELSKEEGKQIHTWLIENKKEELEKLNKEFKEM